MCELGLVMLSLAHPLSPPFSPRLPPAPQQPPASGVERAQRGHSPRPAPAPGKGQRALWPRLSAPARPPWPRTAGTGTAGVSSAGPSCSCPGLALRLLPVRTRRPSAARASGHGVRGGGRRPSCALSAGGPGSRLAAPRAALARPVLLPQHLDSAHRREGGGRGSHGADRGPRRWNNEAAGAAAACRTRQPGRRGARLGDPGAAGFVLIQGWGGNRGRRKQSWGFQPPPHPTWCPSGPALGWHCSPMLPFGDTGLVIQHQAEAGEGRPGRGFTRGVGGRCSRRRRAGRRAGARRRGAARLRLRAAAARAAGGRRYRPRSRFFQSQC